MQDAAKRGVVAAAISLHVHLPVETGALGSNPWIGPWPYQFSGESSLFPTILSELPGSIQKSP